MAKNTSTTAETITSEANNPDVKSSSVVTTPEGQVSTPWGTILNKWTTTGVNSAWVTTDNIWPDWKPWDHTKDEAIASWKIPTPSWTTWEWTTWTSPEDTILADNKKVWEELDANNKQAASDLEAQKKADEERAKKHADDTANIIKTWDDWINKIEVDRKDRLEWERTDEIARLADERDLTAKNAELNLQALEAKWEYQRIQNQNAIVQANAQVEIERQQSAWAYQKLWLWFSSGIINQSQQIATDWIAKIAEIKAKMNYEEALIWVEIWKIGIEIDKINLEYNWLINKTISVYSDKLDDLDIAAEKRISEQTKNLLLNSQQKEDKIAGILNKYRTDKTDLERQHIDDMIKVQDRGFQYQQTIELAVERKENIGRTKINDRLKDGSLFTMSDLELEQLAMWAGQNITQMKALKKTAIASWVSTTATSMLWSDYIIWEIDRNKINMKVDTLIQWGKTLQEATEIATKEVLSQTQEWKDIQNVKAANVKKSLQSAVSKSSGPSWYIPKAADITPWISDDWKKMFTNEITRETWFATEKWLVEIKVWRSTEDWPKYDTYDGYWEVPIKARTTPIKWEDWYHTWSWEAILDEEWNQIKAPKDTSTSDLYKFLNGETEEWEGK